MREEFLKQCVAQGYSHEAQKQFSQAVDFAEKYLAAQRRLSGESYCQHNLRVGMILAEQRAAPEVVKAGLLHGILKYSSADELRSSFGTEILHLVQGDEEIASIKSRNRQLQAESLRKIILMTLKDVRVLLVKLATKLENLRTIEVFPPEEQKRLAQEVLDVYAPLAYRLGVEKIRVQLEDTAFKVLYPQKYQEIMVFLEESREEREKHIAEGITLIKKLAEGNVELLKIKGRPKHLYSIYRKVQERGVPLSQQHDLLGVRILVSDEKDCYTLLGLLHEHCEPLEGRLKDYIATPKPNGYRSLHTGVRLPSGNPIEVQIRTAEMDEFAEEGIAAHWRYKGVKSEQAFEKKVAWLRGILDLQQDAQTKEFLEAAKVDVFGDVIHCYTPKGDLKELPKGASLLDFAYTIHQDIGNHAVGGRVNGKFVALKEELAKGDVVEIITNKNQRPRRGWLKIVKSARARQKIRQSLKEHEKLAALHFRTLKPEVTEEQGVLVESPSFPAALCILAKCCCPIPDQDIVGIPTKRRVVSIHQRDCRAALKEEGRWMKVQWKQRFNQLIRFYVEADERSGILADLLHTTAQVGFEVKEAKAKLVDVGRAQCSFLIVPRDLEQMKELVRRLMKVKGVKRMHFE